MKIWNYIIIFVGLSLLFQISGIGIDGVGSLLFKLGFFDTEGIVQLDSNNSFRTTIILILIGAAAAGLVIGYITKSKSENYVVLPIITGIGVSFGIFTFINLGYAIISYGFTQAAWIGYITLVLLGPLTIGFIFALIEFFKGTD